MKKISWFFLMAALLALSGMGLVYYYFLENNVKQNKGKPWELHIYESDSIPTLLEKLDGILLHKKSFENLMGLYKFSNLRPGRFLISEGMNNHSILIKLRTCSQDPVRLAIHGVRDIPQLCGKISKSLMTDSLSFLQYLSDTSVIRRAGFTPENFLSVFIPNTYEMYWTVKPDKFLQRIIAEHQKYWSKNNRTQLALKNNLTKEQVFTLASIVEKETIAEEERPAIAGVYINRLKTGMKLQADPTVVYALGLFGIQRVLLEHLKFDSPYNTYLVDGLPPGPICLPSLNSIEAVLNPEPHDFIFFCAKPGRDGRHSFAKTLQSHCENAKMYREWLNSQSIR